MLLKELYESMYGKVKLNEDIPDDQMIDYVEDGEKKEMPAGSAKTMGKDHPAKIEYEKLKDGGGDTKKGVNIFDKPADEPKSDDMQAIGKNTPAKKAESPEVQHISDYFFDSMKNYDVNANDAAVFAMQHYKALTGEEYDFQESSFDEAVIDFMETVVGEDYDWQDDWNSAHEGNARSYDEGEFTDYSDEIPPMDGQKSEKSSAEDDDSKQIGGPNGLEMDRDEISKLIMKDPEVKDILGDDDDVYWDDADLVSSKWDDVTIATIDPDDPYETIRALKQRVKDWYFVGRHTESARTILPKGSLRKIQENWVKKNLL